MDLFSEFCNICYTVTDGNLKEISNENMKHFKDTLITIVGHANIINHNQIYLCQFCCAELIRFDKFKEMCFSHLIQLRQTYFNMLSKLELEDDTAAAKNTLERFVREEVLRRNCLEKSNYSDSISTKHEIIKSSEDLNTNSVLNRQLINLQSQRNENEFDGDCSDVSGINNVIVFEEINVPITIEEDVKNEIRFYEGIKSEQFESEDFYMPGINNDNATNSLLDFKVPVLNDSEENVHSGVDSTEQELNVKQENSALEILELENVNMEHCGHDGIRSEEAIVGMKLRDRTFNKPALMMAHYYDNNELVDMLLVYGECLQHAAEVGVEAIDKTIPFEEKPIAQKMNCPCYGRTAVKLDVHKRVNPDAEPHTCSVCNKTFRTKRHLTVHERTHNDARPYNCTICNKAFRHLSHLVVHERIHSGDKPYKCTLCNNTYTRSHLIVHERTHNDDRPFKCTICNKAFKYSSHLVVHKRLHSGDRPYKCTLCNNTYTQRSHLIVHERTHNDDRPFKCTMCNKAYTISSHLIVHKRTHSGDRPYKCTMCNKAFMHSPSLTVHKRIHSAEKPYKCNICNKAFRYSSHLVAHKRIHSGDKPYKCTLCKKSFKQKSALIVHERLHKGDRPFKCTVCDKAYTASSNLIIHKRKHNDGRP